MKSAIRTAILAIMTASCAAGQSAAYSPLFTNEALNGRGWSSLSDSKRAVFLVGLSDGVKATCADNEAIPVCAKHGPRITPNERAAQISALYRDERNLRIPVFEVARVVVKQIVGASDSEVEQALLELRKKYR
jgi:hypothetical protein